MNLHQLIRAFPIFLMALVSSPALAALAPDQSPDVAVASIQSSGQFETPAFQAVEFQPYGPEHGAFDAYTLPEIMPVSGQSIIAAFWLCLVLALVLTVAFAFRFTRQRDAGGSPIRGFTLSSKLILGFGGLASVIIGVSALAISGGVRSQKSMNDYSTIVGNAKLLESLQRDVLMVRMNAKDFLLRHADQDLEKYSDYMGSVMNKIETANGVVKSPERLEMIAEIEDLLTTYQGSFSQAVDAISEQNGMLDSQLDPTMDRVVDLMVWAKASSKAEGESYAAAELGEALFYLQQSRIGMLTFLKSGDDAQQQFAAEQKSLAISKITQALDEIKNPAHVAALNEAVDGIEFFSSRMDRLVELVNERNDILEGSLNIIGPQIAGKGDSLVGSINASRTEIKKKTESSAASAQWVLMITGAVVMIIAIAVMILIIKSVKSSMCSFSSRFTEIANGDLTVRIEEGRDELGLLAQNFNGFADQIQNIIAEVAGSANEVASAATEIAASNEELSQGMSNQQIQSSQVSAAVEQMSSSVSEVALKAKDASDAATLSGQQAERGGQIVQSTVEGMESINCEVEETATSVAELGKRGEQIGEIIAVINDIADQTNLLALNAAIEAARAGEHGRGFAVVADEVRKLAERTTHATTEVSESIRAIQDETQKAVERMDVSTDRVNDGMGYAREAGESLSAIVCSSQDVAGMIQSIAASADEQSAASGEISRSVQEINSVTEESARSVEQAATAANQLSYKAEQLQMLVSKFKVA